MIDIVEMEVEAEVGVVEVSKGERNKRHKESDNGKNGENHSEGKGTSKTKRKPSKKPTRKTVSDSGRLECSERLIKKYGVSLSHLFEINNLGLERKVVRDGRIVVKPYRNSQSTPEVIKFVRTIKGEFGSKEVSEKFNISSNNASNILRRLAAKGTIVLSRGGRINFYKSVK